jgi:hypothetical protein
MPAAARQSEQTSKWTISTGGWSTERWAAIIVLGALAALIAIRMGFRGVNALGVNVSVN